MLEIRHGTSFVVLSGPGAQRSYGGARLHDGSFAMSCTFRHELYELNAARGAFPPFLSYEAAGGVTF